MTSRNDPNDLDIRGLLTDDSAVSPVIGVILMVAITVILAAVIGTFVLGLGQQTQDTAPQASFSMDFDDDVTANGVTYDNLTVTHDGGEAIASGDLNLTAGVEFDNATHGTIIDEDSSSLSFDSMGLSGDVSAGDSVVVVNATSSVEFNGATFRVVWNSASTDQSATLREYEVPE